MVYGGYGHGDGWVVRLGRGVRGQGSLTQDYGGHGRNTNPDYNIHSATINFKLSIGVLFSPFKEAL